MMEIDNQEKFKASQEVPERAKSETEAGSEERYQQTLVDLRQKMSTAMSRNEIIPGQIFDTLFGGPEQRSDLEIVYGAEQIAHLESELNSLVIEDKEQLVGLVVDRVVPFIRSYYFDPDVSARAVQLEQRIRGESFKAGQMDCYVTTSPWEFTIAAGTAGEVRVIVADKIMEISWPEQSRWGWQALQESLKEVTKVLSEHPEVKAVVGLSWMMSHPAAGSLGFERFPDLPVEAGQRDSILKMVTTARRDKPHQPGKQPKPADVIVGAMSREEFLHRFS